MTDPKHADTARTVRRLWRATGLSQRSLARCLGVRAATVNRWCRGWSQPHNLTALTARLRALAADQASAGDPAACRSSTTGDGAPDLPSTEPALVLGTRGT